MSPLRESESCWQIVVASHAGVRYADTRLSGNVRGRTGADTNADVCSPRQSSPAWLTQRLSVRIIYDLLHTVRCNLRQFSSFACWEVYRRDYTVNQKTRLRLSTDNFKSNEINFILQTVYQNRWAGS